MAHSILLPNSNAASTTYNGAGLGLVILMSEIE